MNDHVFIQKSKITGKQYNVFESVKIVNIKQSILYIKNGCELLDLYVSNDRNTGEPIFVFVFPQKESKKYFDLWCKHELK